MERTDIQLLEGLNDSQKKAVLKTEGRVLVLAGAGSGKTRVLTTRIAYLLQEGIEPWKILGITFTNKAAKEMKSRVNAINENAFKSWIGTFHSICYRILSTNIHLLGIEKFTLMDESDQKAMVKAACVNLGIEVDKTIVATMLSQISLWKNDDISPGDALAINQGNKTKTERANIYEQYETMKHSHNYFDFDDLLLRTVRLFRNNSDLLNKYQNTFQYILVDEFQDTNGIQFELLEMLSGRYGNIFLVGDADQSIYSFRSAKIENILKYQNIHPDTELIRLQENYRSTQKIVNASNALVSNNQERLDREAFSVGTLGDNINVLRFNDASREADFISRLIVNIKKSENKNWKDFAVMYRMNFQARHLELALRDENIPYKIVGSVSFYDRKEVKDIVSYLRACHNLSDDYAIQKIINVPKRSIGETTVKKISAFALERRISFYAALKHIDDVAAASKINKPTVARIKTFTELLDDLASSVQTDNFSASKYLTHVLKKTEFMEQFDINTEGDEPRIENITHMRNHAKEWDAKEKDENTLAQFISEISLDSDSDEDEEDYVTLTSVHSAKGLEWSQTFIMGLEDDVFPHFRSKSKPSELEEERRLMYVAMTRAIERLFLTYSTYKYEYNSKKPILQKPSPFLEEIPDQFKTVRYQTA